MISMMSSILEEIDNCHWDPPPMDGPGQDNWERALGLRSGSWRSYGLVKGRQETLEECVSELSDA